MTYDAAPRWTPPVTLVAPTIAISTIYLVAFPRALPAALGLLGLFLSARVWLKGDLPKIVQVDRSTALPLLIATFIFWALLTCLWAPEPRASAMKVLLLTIFAGLLPVILHWIKSQPGIALGRAASGLALGMTIAGTILAFEVLTDQYLMRTVYSVFPSFRQQHLRNLVLDGDVVVMAGETIGNRRVYVWCLLLLPAIMWLTRDKATRADKMILAILAISGLVIFVKTRHQSSQLYLLAAAAGFGLQRFAPQWTRVTLAGSLIGLTLLSVPLASLAYRAELASAPWLFPSAQHRIVIWGHTSNLVLAEPWFGVGADGTAALHEAEKKAAGDGVPIHALTSLLGRHAHNIFIQTWFELGLVGAFIGLATGLVAIGRLGVLPNASNSYATAMSIGTMLSLATSYSLWQPWILALFPCIILVFTTIDRARRD